jgi:hypothetical protein
VERFRQAVLSKCHRNSEEDTRILRPSQIQAVRQTPLPDSVRTPKAGVDVGSHLTRAQTPRKRARQATRSLLPVVY